MFLSLRFSYNWTLFRYQCWKLQCIKTITLHCYYHMPKAERYTICVVSPSIRPSDLHSSINKINSAGDIDSTNCLFYSFYAVHPSAPIKNKKILGDGCQFNQFACFNTWLKYSDYFPLIICLLLFSHFFKFITDSWTTEMSKLVYNFDNRWIIYQFCTLKNKPIVHWLFKKRGYWLL